MKFYIHAIINWVFLLKWPNYSEYSPKSACVFVSILPHEASSGTFWKRNEEENKYVRQYGLAYIWYTMAVRPVSVLSRQKGILKRRSRQWIWGSIFFFVCWCWLKQLSQILQSPRTARKGTNNCTYHLKLIFRQNSNDCLLSSSVRINWLWILSIRPFSSC